LLAFNTCALRLVGFVCKEEVDIGCAVVVGAVVAVTVVTIVVPVVEDCATVIEVTCIAGDCGFVITLVCGWIVCCCVGVG